MVCQQSKSKPNGSFMGDALWLGPRMGTNQKKIGACVLNNGIRTTPVPIMLLRNRPANGPLQRVLSPLSINSLSDDILPFATQSKGPDMATRNALMIAMIAQIYHHQQQWNHRQTLNQKKGMFVTGRVRLFVVVNAKASPEIQWHCQGSTFWNFPGPVECRHCDNEPPSKPLLQAADRWCSNSVYQQKDVFFMPNKNGKNREERNKLKTEGWKQRSAQPNSCK